MKKLFGALLSILMLLSIIMPISAETTTATSNPGVLYFGGKALETDNLELNETTKAQEFTISGVDKLSVNVKYKEIDNNFILNEVTKKENGEYVFKLPYFLISSLELNYVDAAGTNINRLITIVDKAHHESSTIEYKFAYGFIGRYYVDGKEYNLTIESTSGTRNIVINGQKIENINVLNGGKKFSFEFDGLSFETEPYSIGDGLFKDKLLINGKVYKKHHADVRIVGIPLSVALGDFDESKTVDVALNETITLQATNIHKYIYGSIGSICTDSDHKKVEGYTVKNESENNYEIKVAFNKVGTYYLGVSAVSGSATFRINVVENKAEVLNSINKDNAEDVITSLQNVINPNNTNVSLKDVKTVNDNYKAITGNNVSEKVDGTVKGFDVDGLAPALVSLEAGKASQQTATMSVNESKETIKLPETLKAELVKTLDISVSSTENKLSTSELQLPVAITFNPSDMGVKVANGETLKVVREHNGQQDVLDATKNSDGTFTFVTDKFSTYGIIKVEDVVVEETKPVAPSVHCAGSKDKNCDGVVTCDEEKGLGWEWNNDKKVCEFKGNSNVFIVNTATK